MNRQRVALLALVAASVVAVLAVVVADDDGPETDARASSSTQGTERDDDGSGGGRREQTTSTAPVDVGTSVDAGEDTVSPSVDDGSGPIPEDPSADPSATAAPVPLDAPTDFGDGVGVRLAAIEATTAEARLPGERSGPALLVTVELVNRSEATADLDHVTVDLIDGSGASVPMVTDPDRRPLSGELPAGATATGQYVYSIDPDERRGIRVSVKYSADTPTVVFAGDAPAGG